MKKALWILWIGFLLAAGLTAGLPAGAQGKDAGDDRTIFLPVVSKGGDVSQPGQPGGCLSAKEAELATLINQYRVSLGLPAVAVSKSLTMVGQTHVKDLQTYHPDEGTDPRGLECNLHSWSAQGYWTPVCYTSDHYYASKVWSKPKEVTRGVYAAYGYENSAWWSGWDISAGQILDLWKNSPGHNNMIIEQGGWQGSKWKALGVGISDNYAVMWMGGSADPAGSIQACP